MSEPKLFLWPYIYFLLNDGIQGEAFALIAELKKAEGEYGEFAKLLEQKALSVVREEKVKK